MLSFNLIYNLEAVAALIFDQWQKLHLGLDALSNQKFLKGIYEAIFTKLSVVSVFNISKEFFKRKAQYVIHAYFDSTR
jgi:hypothetical protein